MDTTVIIDIETTGLLNQKDPAIHCIAMKVNDDKTKVFTSKQVEGSDGSLEDWYNLVKLGTFDGATLIAHNGIKFDIPYIKNISGIDLWDYFEIVDTLIMANLAYPNIGLIDSNNKSIPPRLKGSHSLKAWGHRLREYKGEYSDWSKLTAEMIHYCRQDVEVTYKLYNTLLKKKVNPESIYIEQAFARIIQRQEEYGVLFDVKKAQNLYVELLSEFEQLQQELEDKVKPLYLPVGKEKTQADYKKKFPFVMKGITYAGSFQNIDLTNFNPKSTKHVSIWLHRLYGWVSPIFTDKGSPKVDEETLEALDFPEAQLILSYKRITGVMEKLVTGNSSWLNAVNSQTGRVHGQVQTLGAVTRRCTHNHPNLAQVPTPRKYKGNECRSLFIAPKGRKLVGCDADSLELRTFSHYLYRYDGGKFGKAVDEGKKEDGTDAHTLNQKKAGLPTRDDAKTFIYALLYGAGDGKLGLIRKGGVKEGKDLRAKFLRGMPEYGLLLKAVQSKVKAKGTLKYLDGYNAYIRSQHSALNSLLQGAGALIMKYYLVQLDRNLQKKYKPKGVDYEFILNIHDEVQIECKEELAEDIATICKQTFVEVGELLKLNIPLKGDASIGNNWAETH